MARKVRARVRGNDADGARNEIHAEGSVRLTEIKDDRGVVGRFDGGNHAKGALLWDLLVGFLMNSNVALTSAEAIVRHRGEDGKRM